MATATHAVGRIGEFDPQSESITTYLERLALYMEANGVADDKKVAVLLTVIGPKTYGILKSLLSPTLPQDKSLDALKEALKSHYDPKPSVIAERFRFYQRSQTENESVADFAADLRRLTIRCEFGDFLSQALRDKFVCGVRSNAVQKKLLTEDAKLTAEKALEIAQGMETAEQDVRALKGNTSSTVLHLPAKVEANKKKQQRPCYRCGKTNHSESECRFREVTCHKCGKRGHIASACRSKAKGQSPRSGNRRQPRAAEQTKWVETPNDVSSAQDDDMAIFTIGSDSPRPISVQLELNDTQVTMEVDTGAAVSIMPASVFSSHFPDQQLVQSNVTLKTYTGEPMNVLGQTDMNVKYERQPPQKLTLVVVEGTGPPLLGRNWLQHLKLNWSLIKAVQAGGGSLASVLDRFQDVFADGLGTVTTVKATLSVDPDARPKFCKARPVPLALKGAVEQEIDRLEREGVLEKVDFSEWATPVVAVPKKDGRVRLCGDYKVTVNPALDVDQYPLPRQEDLFASLAGGKHFTTLDLTHAYQQLILDEASRKFVTINTHRGLYRYTRLPFGIASAPAIFQKTMDTILRGMPGVICYIDDILITGKTEKEHLDNLAAVLQKLREHGLRVKKAKCEFMKSCVEYLGHKIDAEGLHALDSKVKAITNAPVPKNVQELRSFLGLLNYYGRFIPNLASILHPLNELLRRNTEWQWSEECNQAFKLAKDKLVSADVLAHYDSTLPLKLAADASAYGIGAVISHSLPDGTERPIAFASRTLSASERNYSQVEKEALALIFGVKRFHTYVYGRQFTLITDHKPLTTILGHNKGIPPVAAARLQRWAIILAAYKYKIEFRPTTAHSNADGLSRLPLKESTRDPETVWCNMMELDSLPVTVAEVRKETRTDPILSKVTQYTVEGWPGLVDQELRVFSQRKNELTVENGCLLWGLRVVVPTKLRAKLLQDLHSDHSGIWKMKAVARSYFWWPGLDKEVEKLASGCVICQSVKNTPPSAPLHPWIWPNHPWERIHLDFAGPFQNTTFLVVVDAHSKWPEVFSMSSTTTTATIAVLRKLFATYGLPMQVVTDNGPQFVSDEFATFLKGNGIKHITSAPYHPATNGLAERFVQSLKQGLKTNLSSGRPLAHRLANFLLSYRSSPQATTGVTPCSLFLKRQMRTRFDLLKPSQERQVMQKQAQQKTQHDSHAKAREFSVGQNVMARNFRPGPKWIPGVVDAKLGPLSYLIRLENDDLWRRHVDHLKGVTVDQSSEGREESTNSDSVVEDWDTSPTERPTSETSQTESSRSENVHAEETPNTEISDNNATETENAPTDPIRRYPTRVRERPSYFRETQTQGST